MKKNVHKVIIESVANFSSGKITGRALVPGISRNGNQYTPDQMESAKNLGVPLKLDWEHTSENIGNVVFTYDNTLQEMHYTGTVTDAKRLAEIKNGSYQVSIEASVDEVMQSCTPKRCYNMLVGLTMEGLAITNSPGITATTLQVMESKQDWNPIITKCESCVSDCLQKKSEMGKDPSDPQQQAICYSECGEKKEATYPWDQCIADQLDRGYTQDQADKICGAIRAQNESTEDLKQKIKDLEAKVAKANTCSTCGKAKKVL